jgi:hypothetical protein
MTEILIPFVILMVGLLVWEIIRHGKTWVFSLIMLGIGLVLYSIIIAIDYSVQTTDTEVWSGTVTGWEHIEEWDEWIPPVTTCTSDAKGNQTCTTTPGYWEHHYAENYIETSDNGSVYVDTLPDGREMDDSYPNDTDELKKYWKEGTPTASTHSYKNKVQASYSVFKHEDIDLEDFPNLPNYPDKVRQDLYIDRFVGSVPNKEEINDLLSEWNAKLGHSKQVNIIFVNVGANKSMEHGFALQDKWEGGNKNDFVVTFSMDTSGNIDWVYPFSWSEVETLKLNIKDYMMTYGKVDDFKPIINEVAKMIEKDFVRKEFADFEYLHIDVSATAKVFLWIVTFVLIGLRGFRRERTRYGYSGDIYYGI